jgi:hypothetical protein
LLGDYPNRDERAIGGQEEPVSRAIGDRPRGLDMALASELCIPGKSAGHSGRKRPPIPEQTGHPGREVRKGLGLGGATTIRL